MSLQLEPCIDCGSRIIVYGFQDNKYKLYCVFCKKETSLRDWHEHAREEWNYLNRVVIRS